MKPQKRDYFYTNIYHWFLLFDLWIWFTPTKTKLNFANQSKPWKRLQHCITEDNSQKQLALYWRLLDFISILPRFERVLSQAALMVAKGVTKHQIMVWSPLLKNLVTLKLDNNVFRNYLSLVDLLWPLLITSNVPNDRCESPLSTCNFKIYQAV